MLTGGRKNKIYLRMYQQQKVEVEKLHRSSKNSYSELPSSQVKNKNYMNLLFSFLCVINGGI